MLSDVYLRAVEHVGTFFVLFFYLSVITNKVISNNAVAAGWVPDFDVFWRILTRLCSAKSMSRKNRIKFQFDWNSNVSQVTTQISNGATDITGVTQYTEYEHEFWILDFRFIPDLYAPFFLQVVYFGSCACAYACAHCSSCAVPRKRQSVQVWN